MTTSHSDIFTEIENYIQKLNTEHISDERKSVLQPLIDYVQTKVSNNEHVRINFICTHNSRRSHLSQIWAQTLAAYCGIQHIACYSGGTEATALFPMVAETLKNVGFTIQTVAPGANPVYAIKYVANAHPIIGFSKTLDDAFNPSSNFAAVMTCSQADEGCPFVPGAEKRVPITYEDPKKFDNTPQQAEKYEERSMQIATEMKYVFSKVAY